MLQPYLLPTDAACLVCETRPHAPVPKLPSFLPSTGCGAMGDYSGWYASRVYPAALPPRIFPFLPFHDISDPRPSHAATPHIRPLQIFLSFSLSFLVCGRYGAPPLILIPAHPQASVPNHIALHSYPRRHHDNSKRAPPLFI
ncbi:hypothetical protein B0H19DRAFT_1272243 [Mycena capillaripes]|nr:hypothetical protein B0H19DRAFT_1272243 [Mycena capillaripes]